MSKEKILPDSSGIEKKRPSRLGRGLSSLMATPVSAEAGAAKAEPGGEEIPGSGSTEKLGASTSKKAATASSDRSLNTVDQSLKRIPTDVIDANPNQPRQRFDKTSLNRLVASIQQDGVIQPIVVRAVAEGRYELVAGERRWRAAKLAGLETLPALIKDLDPLRSAEWALIENLQREDLNPIERAEAFRGLGSNHQLTHDQIAQRVGIERSTVTNLLRLLKLAPEVQEYVVQGRLTMGQSRALASLDQPHDQLALAQQAIKEGWSVRQVEAQVRTLQKQEADAVPTPVKIPRPAYLTDLERQIAEQLSTKVQIKTKRKKGAGTLSIDFYSIDQFDELLAKLGVETNG
ncbi:MAG: ParB/RepB/Spo0J family partition protein [Planctomycetota bacterium]